MLKFKATALAIVWALGSFACSEQKTSEDHLTSARALVSQNDTGAAIVELKNAIKGYPNDAKIRQELGTIYAKQGMYSAAEKELNRAISLGVTDSKVIVYLLRSLHGLGKYEQLIAATNDYASSMDETLLYMYQTIAYIRLEDTENAKLAVAKAKDVSEESAYTFVGAAHIVESEQDFKEKITLAQKAIELDENLVEAYLVLGQLYFLNTEYTRAVEVFSSYSEMLPQDTEAKMFLANSLIKDQQFDKAKTILEKMMKLSPEHAFVNQLMALVLYNQHDYDSAIFHAEKAIQNGLNNAVNRSVLGLSAYKLERFELAHSNLLAASNRLPPQHPINTVLVLVQIKLGYDQKAKGALAGLDELSDADVDLLFQASFNLIEKGMVGDAQSLLMKAEDDTEPTVNNQLRLGLLKLSINDASGLNNLESALEAEPESIQVQTALAKAYIASRDYDKAKSIALAWKENHSDNPAGYILEAQIYIASKEIEKASEQLDLALKLAPNSLFSLVKQTEIQLYNKDLESAQHYLDRALKIAPNNVSVLTILLRLKNAQGKVSQAAEKITEAAKNNSASFQHQLLLAVMKYNQKDFDGALEILKVVPEENAQHSQVYWSTFGDVLTNTGQHEQALALYNKWLQIKPNSKNAHIRKIKSFEQLKRIEEAIEHSSKLLKLNPADFEFRAMAIYYQLLAKQYSQANKILKEAPKEYRSSILFEGFEGEILLKQGQPAQSVAKLKALYQAEKNKRHLILLVEGLHKSSQQQQAFEQVKQHYNEVSQELFVKNLLAEYAIIYDLDYAQKLYREILTVVPNQVAILNNLAWVELELNNIEQAADVSKKALALSPKNPLIMDTRALVLNKLGQKTNAISLLEQAQVLAPNNEKIKEHLLAIRGN